MISRFRSFAVASLLAAAVVSPAMSEDTTQAELAALRLMLEKQGKQLEQLTEEVSKLRQHLGAPAPSAPSSQSASSAHSSAPVVATNEFAPTAIPVAPEAAPNTHIVVKGESLDSIAKLHKTTIQELQRLNKITDPKKLQIGQALQLPPTSEKKENQ